MKISFHDGAVWRTEDPSSVGHSIYSNCSISASSTRGPAAIITRDVPHNLHSAVSPCCCRPKQPFSSKLPAHSDRSITATSSSCSCCSGSSAAIFPAAADLQRAATVAAATADINISARCRPAYEPCPVCTPTGRTDNSLLPHSKVQSATDSAPETARFHRGCDEAS